jgi:hypothetical protein
LSNPSEVGLACDDMDVLGGGTEATPLYVRISGHKKSGFASTTIWIRGRSVVSHSE